MLEFQEYNQLMWVPSFARGKLALPVGNSVGTLGTIMGTQLSRENVNFHS